MTKKGSMKADTADPIAAANQLNVDRVPGKSNEQLMTELAMSPLVRNTMCAKSYAAPWFSGDPPQLNAALEVVTSIAGDVREGNLTKLTDMLAAQAITLDAIFTEYSRRSLLNAGEYLGASQSYTQLRRTCIEANVRFRPIPDIQLTSTFGHVKTSKMRNHESSCLPPRWSDLEHSGPQLEFKKWADLLQGIQQQA